VSSLLGTTHNPYALERVPAGSSGGTAAAVAANFGLVGLGSDTGNSIRGPAAHTALVGIRSTMGLTSRAGVIPLSYLADIAGPMTRTVEDAAAVLQAIVGEDPEDPTTALSRGRASPEYRSALVRDGLQGARIGVLRQAYERSAVDPEILRIFDTALRDLEAAGAEIVDPVRLELPRPRQGACRGFEYDMNEYLRTRGEGAPVQSVEEILRSGRFHESVRGRLQGALSFGGNGPDSDACKAFTAYRAAYGDAVTKAMDELRLDAFVYPTWSFPPQPIGETNQRTAGDNSQELAPISGFPAINVPMGFSRSETLPAGITFFGRAWSEETLIRLAYAYEQATRHRRPPMLAQ
jgi:amidase